MILIILHIATRGDILNLAYEGKCNPNRCACYPYEQKMQNCNSKLRFDLHE